MKKDSNLKAMGIAMGLPSTLLAVIYLMNMLIEKKIVSDTVGYLILGFIVIYLFYLMIRFANEKND